MSAPAPSKLDAAQVLQGAFKESTGELRVAANVTANIAGAQEVVISHVDDSIKIGNGAILAGVSAVGADNGLNVKVLNQLEVTPQGLSVGIQNTVITVGTTPTKIPAVPFANRNSMSVRVWNLADTAVIIYFGKSTVTTANGYPKGHGEEVILDVQDNAAVELYAVVAAGTAEVRVLELA